MRNRLLLIALVLPVLCCSEIAFAADLRDLLIKACGQDQRLSYSGVKETKVYQNGKTITTRFKISHIKPDKTRIVYIFPKNMAGTEIVKIEGKVYQRMSGSDYWVETSQEDDCFASNMLTSFKLSSSGLTSIANNKAIQIVAKSNSMPNLNKQFFIDTDNQAIIKTVSLIDGKIISTTQYLTIDFSPKLSANEITKISGRVIKLSDSKHISFVVMKPTYLPHGFKYIGVSRMVIDGHECAHSRFSDGLNTLSLFQHKGNDSAITRTNTTLKAPVIWKKAGFSFVLIGDIPASELKKISTSVK